MPLEKYSNDPSGYDLLQNEDPSDEYAKSDPPPTSRTYLKPLRARAMGAFIVLLIILAFKLALGFAVPQTSPTAPPLGIPTDIQRLWSSYTPWFSAGNTTALPSGCSITQVNLLQRHGARYPTKNSGKKIKAAVAKLKSVKKYKDSKFDFLKKYKYNLGHDNLVPFGAAQSFDAGQSHYTHYSNLIDDDNLPFVRASSSQRVVDSSTNWTAGFAAASQAKYTSKLSVILSESLNDTLENNCPNALTSDPEVAQWQSVYGPAITARLNSAAPGAGLTNADTSSLMSLCPFETVATESPSPFCALFTESDFEGFEYSGDVDKYYGTGYGNALGPVQGVGYVNELLARLTGQPVVDHTQTNATLDSSPETFPLNRTFYADFSHDNQMAAIYAAIGLFAQANPLSLAVPNAARTWVAALIVPFSSRMITERVQCDNTGAEYVRILVNDVVQPLEFCGGANNGGLCTLDAFVQSQTYARASGNGDFEKCYN